MSFLQQLLFPASSSSTTSTSSSSHKPYQEKILLFYETFFAKKPKKTPTTPSSATTPSTPTGNSSSSSFLKNFNGVNWDEIFLLKVKSAGLNRVLFQFSDQELHKHSHKVKEFANACLKYMDNEAPIRRFHAIKSLIALLRNLFQRKWNASNFSANVITICCGGFQQADSFFKDLISKVNKVILQDAKKVQLQQCALELVIVLLAANLHLHQNFILDYFKMVDISQTLYAVVNQGSSSSSSSSTSSSSSPQSIMIEKNKFYAIICFVLLVYYRKYEGHDSLYANSLASLQDPSCLRSFHHYITKSMYLWNKPFEAYFANQNSLMNWFSTLLSSNNTINLHSSYSLFYDTNNKRMEEDEDELEKSLEAEEEEISKQASAASQAVSTRSVHQLNALLLMFYELIHTNKDFVGALTRSLAMSQAVKAEQQSLGQSTNSSAAAAETSAAAAASSPKAAAATKACPLILQEFLKFCSIVFQESRRAEKSEEEQKGDETTLMFYNHICLNILFCLLEDKNFRAFIFDVTTELNFSIFKKDKEVYSVQAFSGAGCLSKPILQVLLFFIHHHVRKPLYLDPIRRALSIIHLLISLSMQNRVRFTIEWNVLWSSLIRLCDLILNLQPNLNSTSSSSISTTPIAAPAGGNSTNSNYYNNIYVINAQTLPDLVLQTLKQALILFNLAILKGESFLPSRQDHEELIYEFVRQRKVFDLFEDWIVRNFKQKKSTNALSILLQNIKVCITDISMEIDLKYGRSGTSAAGVKEILQTVKKAYSQSKLQNIEDLDTPLEQYLENPNEIPFFNHLLKIFTHQIHSFFVQQNK